MNVPSYDTTRLSFGPGVIYIGPAGQTPTTDVGAVATGAVLTLGRTVLEVRQGSPAQVVKKFMQQEDVTFTFSGLEWNLLNLAQALGVGATSSTAAEDTFAMGGDIEINDVAVRFVHQLPSGGTVEVLLWNASQNAEQAITFGDDLHQFPFSMQANYAATDWAGNALPQGQNLVKIIHQKP